MGGFTISHNEKPQLVSYNEYRVNVYACHFSSTNCPMCYPNEPAPFEVKPYYL